MSEERRIGVLLGGLAAGRETSIRAGETILATLRERGHDACPIFLDRDVDLVLRQTRVDVAFLAVTGRYGEDGCVQGLLEVLGIPYTGSGVLASGLARDKAKAKEIFRLHNLPTPPGYVLDVDGADDVVEGHGSFGFPAVVKPAAEGGGLGVRVAHDELELEQAVDDAFRFGDRVLVERLVEGREITVAVLDGRPLGAAELTGRRDWLTATGRPGSARADGPMHLPARLTPERYRAALRLASAAHLALGCEGATQVDLILSERGNEAILEVNTQPVLTPHGLYARVAQAAGLALGPLLEEILEGARLRAHSHRRERRAVHVPYEGHERRVGLPGHAH